MLCFTCTLGVVFYNRVEIAGGIDTTALPLSHPQGIESRLLCLSLTPNPNLVPLKEFSFGIGSKSDFDNLSQPIAIPF